MQIGEMSSLFTLKTKSNLLWMTIDNICEGMNNLFSYILLENIPKKYFNKFFC